MQIFKQNKYVAFLIIRTGAMYTAVSLKRESCISKWKVIAIAKTTEFEFHGFKW